MLWYGVSEASERGYAAVVYIRSEDSSGNPFVSLLGSKTKLAPEGCIDDHAVGAMRRSPASKVNVSYQRDTKRGGGSR